MRGGFRQYGCIFYSNLVRTGMEIQVELGMEGEALTVQIRDVFL